MRISLLVFLLSLFPNLIAQYIDPYPINSGNGEKMFEFENYQEAVRQYTALLEDQPDNSAYQFYLGKALTYSLINQAKGLAILEELKDSSLNQELKYHETLALAYYKNYRFQEARAWYSKLIDQSMDGAEKEKYLLAMESCDRAIKMVSSPVPVYFENLGEDVNSEAPDYFPLVSPDEGLLFFSTRREGVVGNLYDYKGYRTADIYTSRHRRSSYTRARSVGSPNTYGNEETAGRSENGQYLLYHVDSDDHFSNLFVSEKGRRSYMAPKVFGSEKVNKKSREPSGTLSNDGQTLYFSSNRDGGLGGYDLYMVKRLPNGAWGEPKNLGSPINTAKDELSPHLVDEGSSLYFSSNRDEGLGGLDLYVSHQAEISQWSKPQNLGYPINTVNDDLSICFAENKRYAYVAQKRADSYGDLDIYRLTFKEEREEYTLIKGLVMATDSSLVKEDVLIEVFSKDEYELKGSFLMNKQNSSYVAILPPGKYQIEILNTFGFQDLIKTINLSNKNDFKKEIKLDFFLEPKP